jgi:uncharacterized protein (TIRG00374 family)
MSMEQSGGRRSRLPGWRPLVRWGIAALSVVLVARVGGLGWGEITEAVGLFGDMDPVLIAAVLVLQIAWAVTLAQTQRSAVLAVGGTLAHGHAQRISMGGFTLSRVVPGGGAAGGIFAMRELMRLGQPASVAVTSMTASWAASITSLAVLILGGLLVVASAGEAPGVPIAPAVLVLAGLALVGCVILRALYSERLRRRLIVGIARGVRRLPFKVDAAAIERSFGGIDARQGDGRHLRRSFAWATAAWLCDAAALWLVFAAFGHRLSLTALLVGYGSANLLNSLPELTPGWLGVFETALSATYISLGVPTGIAVAAVLAYRLASFWLPVAAGVAPAVRSLSAASEKRMVAPAPHVAVPARPQVVEVSA